MSMQQLVSETVNQSGGLWPRDKILLKLTEELGELAQAFRKKIREEQLIELGDVGFALCCLAEKEGFSLEEAVALAIEKHVAAIAIKKRIEDIGKRF